MSDMNREEILILLRGHVKTLANYLEPGNAVPKNVLMEGSGPENRGGLNRIVELIAMLPDQKSDTGSGE